LDRRKGRQTRLRGHNDVGLLRASIKAPRSRVRVLAKGHKEIARRHDRWGYAEVLAAIDDPKHERRADLSNWIDEGFGPTIVDADGRLEKSPRSQSDGLENRRPENHGRHNPRSSP